MVKVALLGPEGTYTHQAAKQYFEGLQPVFCSTIRGVFDSEAGTKLVPIENSLGGGVSDTIDLLKQRSQRVTGEVVLPIQHALISDEDSVEDIEKVKSHPQALAQCKEIIQKHDWDTEEVDSTAKAVEGLGEEEAAIASEIAAEINDVSVLKRSIQDRDTNVTRFLVLEGRPESGDLDKSCLILEPEEDRPGVLHAMLSCFAGHGINLTHIQSRPTKEGLGKYFFFVEAQAAGEKLDKAVNCLETYGKVDILGRFSEAERPF
ncbi:MAG: prephenate dehydratase [Candidatus Nanohalobium sp.]